MNEEKIIYLIVGPSASGKTTIASALCKELDLKQLESYTDRPKRFPEETGHVFISPEEFDKLSLQPTLAAVYFDGHRYCITPEQLAATDIFVVEPSGAYEIIEKSESRDKICVIGVTASEVARTARMRLRGESEEAIKTRILEDRRIVRLMHNLCDVIIENNDDLRSAIDNAYDFISYTDFRKYDTTVLLTDAPATFVSVWDGGQRIKSKCKVDMRDRRVYDIEQNTESAFSDVLEVLEEEFICLDANGDDMMFPVCEVDERESAFHFWYSAGSIATASETPAPAALTEEELSFIRFAMEEHVSLAKDGYGSLWKGSVNEEENETARITAKLQTLTGAPDKTDSSPEPKTVIINRLRTEGFRNEVYSSVFHYTGPAQTEKQLVAELHSVVKEFLCTKAGKQAMEKSCNDFNWGDCMMYVTNEFWERHGFFEATTREQISTDVENDAHFDFNATARIFAQREGESMRLVVDTEDCLDVGLYSGTVTVNYETYEELTAMIENGESLFIELERNGEYHPLRANVIQDDADFVFESI